MAAHSGVEQKRLMKVHSQPLYFCLRVPEFPAQALLRLRPAERTQPVVVLEGIPPLEHVCAMNHAARRLGVEYGLSPAELDSFPHLQLLRRSLAEEDNAGAALLQLAESFTPRCQDLRLGLAADESRSPDRSALVLALEMTGTERVFGPPAQAARKLLQAAQALGTSARVAASANLHTAVCAARASEAAVLVIPEGREREALAPLPLSALAPRAEDAATLALWGILTVGELARFSEADLAARLGDPGRQLLRLAQGTQAHLFVPEETAFSLCEKIEFDAPVENLDSLLFVLGPMLGQLLVRAGHRALALASVTATLALEDAPEHVRTVKPALPLFDRELLLKLLHLDLQAHPPGAGVLAVQLSAEPGPRPDVQTGLFSPQLPEPGRLEVTLARIAALVGEDRLGQAVLTDTHAPEAFRMERFAIRQGATAKAVSPQISGAAQDQAQPTRTGVALRRLRPPVRLPSPLKGSAPPQAFYVEGTRYVIRRSFGPWRRSGQWWTTEIWSREEWDIEAASASGSPLLCLLAHDLLRCTWHLEALYD